MVVKFRTAHNLKSKSQYKFLRQLTAYYYNYKLSVLGADCLFYYTIEITYWLLNLRDHITIRIPIWNILRRLKFYY